MTVVCPHCHASIEHGPEAARVVVCPSCGSSFRLEQHPSTVALERPELQTLGRFEVLTVVGLGAFGTVYKARDPELDRTVAIKVPRPGNVGSGEYRERFLREARSVAQLRH